MVKYIKNMSEFNTLMETEDKLIVVDFTASWCGPCKFIAPIFEKLADENRDAEFVKVDVDEASDIAESVGISAMPTFHFYKNGSKIDEMMGADQKTLAGKVAAHK